VGLDVMGAPAGFAWKAILHDIPGRDQGAKGTVLAAGSGLDCVCKYTSLGTDLLSLYNWTFETRMGWVVSMIWMISLCYCIVV
jgi:hypothetical protein